ncbi:MAG: glycosyltransferase family 1 protein [Steroidobacteraceae bacterium]
MLQAGARGRRVGTPTVALKTGPSGRHLVDVTLFFAPTSGGVRRYLLAKHDWLTRHARLKHTVLVPGPRDAGLPYDFMQFASPAIPFGRGYRLPVRMGEFRQKLARLTPDLVEVGDPYHLAGHSLRVARDRGIPTIAFCHSDVVTLAASIMGPPGGRAARRYLADLYARFDAVLAPSAVVAERLAANGIRGIEIQPLGVDVATFHPGARDPSLRDLLKIPADARILVFAGRLSPEKHVGDLVEAARRLGDRYHLLLVGGGSTTPGAANVTHLEYQQDGRQVARLLASCDAFVHAGDQETFGLVVLEAMACGLPVVAARAGALPELVDESVGATFAPRDPDDLARKLAALFEEDRESIGRAARRRAEGYSWDSVFTRMLGRYTRLLSRPSIAARQQVDGR